ncbi:MAG: YkgJ family cysteine cluster protein [Candidatus Methanomethylicota archaeon]|uniref:YkgJ family cysteine cluster protein n=1 Tax=Thermoproteota archaeon TaxID=2056631 RepID=A0A497F2R7_9CREN|nr:MAG: YkgJ family cysteine cluster protein [Candidatus Verstraetearchaeota archaeon]
MTAEYSVEVNCRLPNGRFCAKCCYETKMPLTREDVERIRKLGFKLKDFACWRNGVLTLKNVDCHCVFLDVSSGKCKIYEHRPLGCKLYPLVYDVYSGKVLVDPYCPKANEVKRSATRLQYELVKKVAENILCKSSAKVR